MTRATVERLHMVPDVGFEHRATFRHYLERPLLLMQTRRRRRSKDTWYGSAQFLTASDMTLWTADSVTLMNSSVNKWLRLQQPAVEDNVRAYDSSEQTASTNELAINCLTITETWLRSLLKFSLPVTVHDRLLVTSGNLNTIQYISHWLANTQFTNAQAKQ